MMFGSGRAIVALASAFILERIEGHLSSTIVCRWIITRGSNASRERSRLVLCNCSNCCWIEPDAGDVTTALSFAGPEAVRSPTAREQARLASTHRMPSHDVHQANPGQRRTAQEIG
jgi:hypothetical protein